MRRSVHKARAPAVQSDGCGELLPALCFPVPSSSPLSHQLRGLRAERWMPRFRIGCEEFSV